MSANDQNKYAQFDNLQLQVDKLFKERETSKEEILVVIWTVI